MQTEAGDTERHSQAAGIVYKKICAVCGQQVPAGDATKSDWEQKGSGVWDFLCQSPEAQVQCFRGGAADRQRK